MANKNAGRLDFTVGFNVDTKALQQVKHELQSIQSLDATDIISTKSFQEIEKELKEAKVAASQLEDIFDSAFNKDLGVLNVTKFNNKIKETGIDLSTLRNKLSGAGDVGVSAFRQMSKELLTTDNYVKKTSKTLNNIAETLTKTVRWNIASSAVNKMSGAIQEAWGFTQSLDRSLTDIQIVTSKSSEEMDRFAKRANDAAKALGTTTTKYTDASLTFYQQGLGDEDVNARTETTLKVANVTGMDAKESAEYVTAVANGYQVAANQVEESMDKLAAVGAATASSLAELSQGMAKVAASANSLGVSEDQLAASLSTVIATTRQDAASVGTAFKTIYARISAINAGTEDAETTLSNYTEKMKTMGFNVLDASGHLRDMGEVMEEIGNSWSSMNKEQQISLAQTMAGTRQYNNLIALFDNWDQYQKALNVSMKANGTLQKQQATYAESLAAKLNQLTASKEKVFMNFIDSDSFKDAIDLITKITDKIALMIESVGGGGEILKQLGLTFTMIFNKQIANGIANMAKNIKGYFVNMQNDLAKFEIAQSLKGNSDDVVKRMAEGYIALRPHLEYMNEEEQKIALKLLEEKAILEAESEELKEQIKLKQELVEKASGVTINENASAGTKIKATKNIENKKEKIKTDYENDTATQYNQRVQVLENLVEKQRRLNELKDKGTNATKQELQELKSLQTILNHNIKQAEEFGIDLLDDNERERILETIKDSEAQGKEAADIIFQAIMEKIEEAKNAVKTIPEDINTANNKGNEAKNKDKSFNSILDNSKTEIAIAQMVQLGTEIGQVGMMISQVQQLEGIITNEDLSIGDKFIAILTSISMLMPGIITLFKTYTGIKTALAAATLGLTGSETLEQTLEILLTKAKNDDAKATAILTAAIKKENITRDKNGKITSIDIEATLADAKAKKQAAKATSGLTSESSALAKIITKLGPAGATAAAAILAIGAAVAIVTVSWQIYYKYQAKAEAERAEARAKAAQETFEAAQKEKTATDELIASYKNLANQYESHSLSLDELRDKTRQLLVEYGDYATAVSLVGKSYEELENIMDNLQMEKNNKLIEDATKSMEASVDSVAASAWSNISEKQRDHIGGKRALDLGKEKDVDKIDDILSSYGIDRLGSGHIEWDDLEAVLKDDPMGFVDALRENGSETADKLLDIITGQENWEKVAEASAEKIDASIQNINLETAQKYDKDTHKYTNKDGKEYDLDKVTDVEQATIDLAKEYIEASDGTMGFDEAYSKAQATFVSLNDKVADIYGLLTTWKDPNQDKYDGQKQKVSDISETVRSESSKKGLIPDPDSKNRIVATDDFQTLLKKQLEEGLSYNEIINKNSLNLNNFKDYVNFVNAVNNLTSQLKDFENLDSDNFKVDDLNKLIEYATSLKGIDPKAIDSEQLSLFNPNSSSSKAAKNRASAMQYAEDNDNAEFLQSALVNGVAGKTGDKIIEELENLDESKIEEFTDKYVSRVKDDLAKSWSKNSAGTSNEYISKLIQDSLSGVEIDFDSDEYQNWLKNLKLIEDKYVGLAEKVDILSNKQLIGTEQYNRALQETQDIVSDIELAGAIGKFENTYNDAIEDIREGGEEVQSLLEEIVNADYEINIKIESEIGQEFDEGVKKIENMSAAVKLIGEDYVVAAKDIQELNNTFPGILENYTALGNGTIQLDKQVTQEAIANAKTRAKAEKEETLEAMEADHEKLLSKKNIYELMLGAAKAWAMGAISEENYQAYVSKQTDELKLENNKILTDEKNQNLLDYIANEKQAGIDTTTIATITANEVLTIWNNTIAQLKPALSQIGVNISTENIKPVTSSIENALAGVIDQTTYTQTGKDDGKDKLKGSIDKDKDEEARKQEAVAFWEGQVEAITNAVTNSEGAIEEYRNLGNGLDYDFDNVGSKKDKSSGSKEGDPERLKLVHKEVDLYAEINAQIKELENNYKSLTSAQKRLTGPQLIKNLNAQLSNLKAQNGALQTKIKMEQKHNQWIKKQFAQELKGFQATLDKEKQNNKVKATGIKFDKEGFITQNSLIKVTKEREDHINKLTKEYNAMTKARQESQEGVDKKNQIEYEKTMLDQLNKGAEEYNKNVQGINDQTQQIVENLQSAIDINLQKFDYKVNITLELEDAKKQWNEFKTNVLDGKADTVEGKSEVNYKNFKTTSKNLETYKNKVGDDINYIDQASHFVENNKNLKFDKKTGTYKFKKGTKEEDKQDTYNSLKNNPFVSYDKEKGTVMFDRAKAEETLKTDKDTVQKAMTEMREASVAAIEAVGEAFDEVQNAMDKKINHMEQRNSIREEGAKLAGLTGDKKSQVKFLEKRDEGNQAQLNQYLREAEHWKGQITVTANALKETAKVYGKNSEEYKKASKNFEEANEKYLDNSEKAVQKATESIEDAMETLKAKVALASDDMYKKMFGADAATVKLDWELDNLDKGQYLDTVNSLYELNALQDKYTSALNNTKSVKVQKQITDLMNEQMEALGKKEKLSKYDVERAQKLLDIEIQKAAVEDARNNKSKMNLQRDSQGNYSYVYTADNDKMQEAQDKLAKMNNDLYNFDVARQEELEKRMLEIGQDYATKIAEIWSNTELTYEQKMKQAEKVADAYSAYMIDLNTDLTNAQKNLNASAMSAINYEYEHSSAVFSTKAAESVANWGSMSTGLKEEAIGKGGFIPTINEHIQTLSNAISGDEDGLKGITKKSFGDMQAAAETFDGVVETTGNKIKGNKKDLYSKISAIISKTDDYNELLKTNAHRAKKSAEHTLNYAKQLRKAWKNQEKMWKWSTNAAEAGEKLYESMLKQDGAIKDLGIDADATSTAFDGLITDFDTALTYLQTWNETSMENKTATVTTNHVDNYTSNGGPVQTSKEKINLATTEESRVLGKDAIRYHFKYKGKEYSSTQTDRSKAKENAIADFRKQGFTEDKYEFFKSGGYTGEWSGGSEEKNGKLGVLHQKELVLNENDTENILTAVKLTRTLETVMRSIEDMTKDYMNSLYDKRMNDYGNKINNTNNTQENNITINASFPNVSSSSEIEKAFNQIKVKASQRISKNVMR